MANNQEPEQGQAKTLSKGIAHLLDIADHPSRYGPSSNSYTSGKTELEVSAVLHPVQYL